MELTEAIAKIINNFDELLQKQKVHVNLWWVSEETVFVAATDNEEDYEGSQTQIGVSKDGKVRWEYQSHCSCNSYETSEELGTEITKEEMTKKSFSFETVPEDYEQLIIKFAETGEVQKY